MIESILHFLKIHGKVILGNSAIVVQNMLGKTPKALDAVDMVFRFLVDQCFRVINGVVLPQTLQRIVAPKTIRVVDRTLSRFLSDDGHEFIFRHMLHNSRIDPSITLQESKNDAFTSRSASALSFASAAKVRLVHFHLTVQLATLKLRHMVDRFSKLLVDARNRLVVDAEIMRETIRRLLLVKSLDDSDFGTQTLQRFLFSARFVSASHISSLCLAYSKRPAENALSTPQKVGRTTENVLLPLCHMDILVPYGYETH